MAANTSSESTGKKNYYSVAYGKLTTSVKEVPEGYSEITEADLKSKTQAVEQIDLRKKYLNKGKGDYPYKVFYDSLTGVITAQEKFENDNGTNLNLTVLDNDGDTSIVQIKFYSKYAENILNRLLNAPTNKELVFFPYAIPNEAEIEGKKISFYIQGVSLKSGGVKIEPKFKHDDPLLPPTEQVKVSGKATTSRDNRLDFLYVEFVKTFSPATSSTPPQEKVSEPAPYKGKIEMSAHIPDTVDDLPFG